MLPVCKDCHSLSVSVTIALKTTVVGGGVAMIEDSESFLFKMKATNAHLAAGGEVVKG